MNVETAILTALRRIMRASDLHSMELSRRHGLTGPQLIVLNRLRSQSTGVPVGQLARDISLAQPTVTGIISRLERQGMVIRQRSTGDRRSVEVSLTDAGRRAADEAPPLLQERFLANLRAAEPWERTQILATLQRIVAMMEADRLAASPVLFHGPLEGPPVADPPPSTEVS